MRDTGGVDRIVLQGIVVADVSVTSGASSTVKIEIAETLTGAGDGGWITFDFSTFGTNGIDEIKFDDGTIWTKSDISAQLTSVAATAGDDRLTGTSGADVLAGLKGDDRLEGGNGADTYVFSRGDGADVIDDAFSVPNSLQIAGYALDEVSFDRRGIDGRDLIVRLDGVGDEIEIVDGVLAGRLPIETITLTDDGTVITRAQIDAALLADQTTDADDIVVGTSSAETVTCGPGTDLLDARDGDGDDVYVYARGDGDDRISDSGKDSADVLRLPDYVPGDLDYALRAGAASPDLVLLFSGARNRLILDSALSDDDAGIETIEWGDGTVWTRDDMRAQAIEYAQTGASEPVQGFDGDDRFAGSAGNDTMAGRDGSDIYVMARGHGHATIVEGPSGGSVVDAVELPDFVSSEVSVARLFKGSDSVVLRFASSPDDSLTLTGVLAAGGTGVELLTFSDGVTWTPTRILELLDNNAPVGIDDGYYTATSSEALVLPRRRFCAMISTRTATR